MRLLIAGFVVSVLVNVALGAARSAPEVGAWRSAAGKAEYENAYRSVLAVMPPPSEEKYIRTSYGIAHVMRFGDAEGVPVLLLPGWGSGIPMWAENLPALLRERTVYAVDAVGDSGLGAQDVPFTATADEAEWIVDAMDALGVDRAHLAGHSFGGRIAAEVAVRHPERVATLSLLDPVQTFSGFPAQIYLWSIPAAIPFLPQSWRDATLARIGGVDEVDPNDPMTALIDAGTKHFSSARPFPQQLSDEDLAAMGMPVYVAIAGNSSMHAHSGDAAERARGLLPRGQVVVWEGATHSLPMEEPAEVGAQMLAFMARHHG